MSSAHETRIRGRLPRRRRGIRRHGPDPDPPARPPRRGLRRRPPRPLLLAEPGDGGRRRRPPHRGHRLREPWRRRFLFLLRKRQRRRQRLADLPHGPLGPTPGGHEHRGHPHGVHAQRAGRAARRRTTRWRWGRRPCSRRPVGTTWSTPSTPPPRPADSRARWTTPTRRASSTNWTHGRQRAPGQHLRLPHDPRRQQGRAVQRHRRQGVGLVPGPHRNVRAELDRPRHLDLEDVDLRAPVVRRGLEIVTDSQKDGPAPVPGDDKAATSDEISKVIEEYGGFTYAR